MAPNGSHAVWMRLNSAANASLHHVGRTPFTRDASNLSRVYCARARTHTPPPTVPVLSLKRHTQKTAWWCGAHSASQDNEATPRGRPADRSATCTPQVASGRGGEVERDWANECATYWEGGGGGTGGESRVGRGNPRAIPPLSEAKEGESLLCCRHVG